MHAEIDCIRKASYIKGNWRLNNCVLYTSLEPCPMCLGAIKASRIKKVVFGAYTSTNVQPPIQKLINQNSINQTRYDQDAIPDKNDYTLEIVGGILEEQASIMLKRFFQQRRSESVQ